MKNKLKEIIRFTKFGCVGCVNTLITLIVYTVLNHFGVFYVVSQMIGYICGMANSFFMNRKFVFKTAKTDIDLIIRFFGVQIICLLANTLLLIFINFIINNKMTSELITVGIIMVINYFLNKKFVFKTKF